MINRIFSFNTFRIFFHTDPRPLIIAVILPSLIFHHLLIIITIGIIISIIKITLVVVVDALVFVFDILLLKAVLLLPLLFWLFYYCCYEYFACFNTSVASSLNIITISSYSVIKQKHGVVVWIQAVSFADTRLNYSVYTFPYWVRSSLKQINLTNISRYLLLIYSGRIYLQATYHSRWVSFTAIVNHYKAANWNKI